MDQFPPDIDHDPFFPELRFAEAPSAKPVRSRGEVPPRVIPSGSSTRARAAERKTGPSRSEGCCPGTMTTVHSNVHKRRTAKRAQLAFDSHSARDSSGQFQPTEKKKKQTRSSRREMLPPFSLSLTVRIGALTNAYRKVCVRLAFDFYAKRVGRSPSLTDLRNILKA